MLTILFAGANALAVTTSNGVSVISSGVIALSTIFAFLRPSVRIVFFMK